MDEEAARRAWSCLADEELARRRLRLNWSGIDLNHKYYNYLVSGNPDLHYLVHFIEKYIHSPARVLSLGCGNGHLERVLLEFHLPCKTMQGIDINPELVQYANQEASQRGYTNLSYAAGDLDRISLPAASFDLVIFFHSLHHVQNLEGLLQSVHDALTDQGILLVVDFVGPTRWQWTDSQIRFAQELLDVLPDELKVDLREGSSGRPKSLIERPSIEEVVRQDPSESVRSGEIMQLLRGTFDVVEEKPMGGTLLNLLYDGIAGNFDEENPYVRGLIRSLQKTEELLMRNRVIPSDFVFLVLRRRHRRQSLRADGRARDRAIAPV
jgi:SAM-dependent methyltransferase